MKSVLDFGLFMAKNYLTGFILAQNFNE